MDGLDKLFEGKKAYIIVIALFIAMTLVRFYGIALHSTTTVPGADADTYQSLWDLWWVNHALFKLHTSILNTKLIFWPIGANLIYQTFAPIASIISAPFQVVSVPFAHNVLFFLGFIVSGVCMFVLADYIVANRYAAFFAAVIFTFSATHITQSFAYLQWMFWGWVPLSLYFLLRILKEKRSYYNVLGLSVSFILAVFMGNIEEGILVVILCATVLVAYLANQDTRKTILKKGTWVQLALAAVLIFILSSWYVIPLANALFSSKPSNQISQGLISIANQQNSIDYNIHNSMDFFSFFLPSFYNGIGTNSLLDSYYLKIFSVASIEKTGYLAYTAIILALIGIAWKGRKTALWIGIFVLFAWLSMGPYLQFYGNNTGIPGPYLIYHAIPLVNVIREPGRFLLVAIMALSILAAYGFMALDKLFRERTGNKWITCALLAAVLVVFFIETIGTPITNSSAITPLTTTPTIPSFYYALKNMTYNFSIMQLPAIPSINGQSYFYPAEAEYYASVSGKPLVGGYITRTNYTEYAYMYYMPLAIQAKNLQDFGEPIYVSPVLENYTNQSLLALYNFNTEFIIVNDKAYNTTSLSYLYEELVGTFGNPVYSENSTTVFSTGGAIQRALFKSFVAYPVLYDWNYTVANRYGIASGIWSPKGDGLVAVFAPYPEGVDFSNASIMANYTVNATLSFVAVSPEQGASLQIMEQSGIAAPEMLGTINVTSSPQEHTMRISGLASGDMGNYLMFIPQTGSGTGEVYVYNITVSR